MAEKKSSPAMEFVIAQLKKNPNVEYAVVKNAASKKGLTIFPIMYGRAKTLLGLIKMAPRGSRKKKAAARATARARTAAGSRTIGRNGNNDTLDSLQSMIEDMKELARQRDQYRHALEQMSRIIEEVL